MCARIANIEIAEKTFFFKIEFKYFFPVVEMKNTIKVLEFKGFFCCPKTLDNYFLSLYCIKDGKEIDPCMGSGHILVYAFDVLMQIYTSEGYSEREAAKLILEKNLFGLEIDRRAYQLAYFALMMKGRQYNRRIMSLGIRPQIYEPTGYPDGKEYGSLLKVDQLEPMPEQQNELQINLFDRSFETMLNTWNFRRLLAQKYDVVVTNPPYMGGTGMSPKLDKYVKDYYFDSKSDMFSAFIEKCDELLSMRGYQAMITMESWMFLSSFEKMRTRLLSEKTIVNMVHMPYLGKGGTSLGINFGTTMFIMNKTHIEDYLAQYDYIRYYETDTDGVPLHFPTINERWRAASIESFKLIPGSPIVYWASNQIHEAFINGKELATIAEPRQGVKTLDNNRFLRLWFEVEDTRINYNCSSIDEAVVSKSKWFPYNKGGEYRKWYGNNEYVVNWENDGFEMKQLAVEKYNSVTRTITNISYFFKRGLTWSALTTGSFSIRSFNEGFLFDSKGSSMYFNSDYERSILIGFLNSKVAAFLLRMLAPTLDFNVGPMKRLPILFDEEKGKEIVDKTDSNISLSKVDWDSFETSWEFKRHPLIGSTRTVKEAFGRWERESANRFERLKSNEEELNRIYIEIYGLFEELTPEVDDKDVTVHRADLGREMRSLISYAVGCIFGRYSLDSQGLAYAGGTWDTDKYKTFPVDKDNILPICDDDYFDDDITGRFIDFIKIVYGADSLEENLKFIADALGGKGTPREVIRNYFLNDFYKDHVKIYQKRPIYWLFDSGKKNGFKALIYMHRYSRDLLAKLRTDYVHEQQERYRTQLSHIVSALNTASGADRAKLLKQQDKLTEQLREITDFEEKIHHLADQNIMIDLDNGVKKNYKIFADVLAKI